MRCQAVFWHQNVVFNLKNFQHPCYERAARAERKSALQGSGLVRTVGPCAQRRVALTPQAIARALLNDRHESATRFERPAEQVLVLAIDPQGK